MIPRIKELLPLENYVLRVIFDDGKAVLYDVKDDMKTLPGYAELKEINGLFRHAQLDESRTCVFWNDYIDLPSDTIYEYGVESDAADRALIAEYERDPEKDISFSLENCKKEWGLS